MKSHDCRKTKRSHRRIKFLRTTMNWRNFLSLLVCLLALTTIVSFANSTTITHRYLIPEPHLIELSDGHQLMDFVKSYQLGKIGEPSLPHIPVQLLLPPGHIAHSIRIQFKNQIKFKENVRLAPMQHPRNEALPGPVQILKHHVYSSQNIYTAPGSNEIIVTFILRNYD